MKQVWRRSQRKFRHRRQKHYTQTESKIITLIQKVEEGHPKGGCNVASKAGRENTLIYGV